MSVIYEILISVLILIGGVTIGFLILKTFDFVRFKDEIKLKKTVEEHYHNVCSGIEEFNINLSNKEEMFLEDLKGYLKCQNITISSEVYLRDIFCLHIDDSQSKILKELMFYTQKKYYCASDVYILFNFVEDKFTKYLDHNDVSSSELNISLFGSDKLEEDEVIDKLLELSTLEFIKKFSSL